jgi:hypothetical protein
MPEKFQSKIDWFGRLFNLVPPIIMTCLLLVVITGITPIPPEPVLICTIYFWAWVLLVWNFSYYELTNDSLIARRAYFFYRKIRLKEITHLQKSNFGVGPIYGLSKDVLIIRLKKGRPLNISPRDPDGLIEAIEKRRSLL